VTAERAALAGMDNSDGLFDAVAAMTGSTLGVVLDLDAIPLSPCCA
jgi:thiamine monophosphate kinase